MASQFCDEQYSALGEAAFNLPGCDNPQALAELRWAADVQTTITIANAASALNSVLSKPDCAGMFNLAQFGTNITSLINQVSWQTADLHDSSLYAETFEPNETGNPNPGHYSIIFNSGLGNPNIDGGIRGADDTIIHELLHVASLMYGAAAVPAGWSDNDGGGDPASQQNQATNQSIVTKNCFN